MSEIANDRSVGIAGGQGDSGVLGVTADDQPDLVPARMLNEFAYCPRLAYMEWVQGEFEQSVDTLEGKLQHRRVDASGGPILVPPQDEDEAAQPETVHARSVLLSSQQAGIIARIDIVETEGASATPVDYKHGQAPRPGHVPWEPERVQLCAQALILRENGYRCETGILYYVASRTRVPVVIDDELVARTTSLVRELRQTFARGGIPPALVDSPKCPRCSLVGICLPDEVNALAVRTERRPETRRLVPARDDALPVYVQEQGASVGKSGDRLLIRAGQKELQSVRLIDVSQLCVFGNVQISTQALRELCSREIPVCYYTFGGWFTAITHGMTHKNVELRRRQYEAARDPETSLALARVFIQGKIKNSRTMLRRNHSGLGAAVLREMSRLAQRAVLADSPETLLGTEGAAARAYFANFAGMLKTGDPMTFDFQSRNRRPPRDPVNALLSFAYALLTKELTIVVMAVGFDPYLGFFHQPRYGRPALALDLVEEFRPLLADSVVLGALNNGEIRSDDFVGAAGAVALTPRGRRKFLASYERRLDTLITHPVFGYAISYRRVLEVQARLLGRYLTGEITSYPAFLTR